MHEQLSYGDGSLWIADERGITPVEEERRRSQDHDPISIGEFREPAAQGQQVQHGGGCLQLVAIRALHLTEQGDVEALDLAHGDRDLGRRHVLRELLLERDSEVGMMDAFARFGVGGERAPRLAVEEEDRRIVRRSMVGADAIRL